MLIKNLSISKKISLSFLFIALINVAFGLFLASELNNIKKELLNYTDDTLPAMEKVDSIRDDLSRWRRTQFVAYTLNDEQKITSQIARNVQAGDMIARQMREYGKTVWPGDEQAAYDRLMRNWQNYTQTMLQFNDALRANDKARAHQILFQSHATFDSLNEELTTLIAILKQAMDSNKGTILSSVNTLGNSSIVINLMVVLLMIGMTWILTRVICGPLQLVVDQANSISTGDLSKELDRDAIGNDELGNLADATTKMQNDLRQVIEGVIAAVTQLSNAVEEMNQISNLSAAGMEEQQQQITHIATAMTQMKATVADVASNTEECARQAEQASQRTQHGVTQNQSMVKGIQEVASVIGAAGDTVAELEEQSNRINVVVDVIRDIADQTNLLALNAAIEAARAGESGRGFAVVADEVRTLAGRTQDSTSEITTIIEQLQSLSKEAKQATELSRSSIAGCTEQGHSSLELISDIEQSISEMSNMGTQIATACNQQDSVAEELNRSIEHIHTASQEVAEGSQQTSQACNELSQLSASLQQMMRRFKLS